MGLIPGSRRFPGEGNESTQVFLSGKSHGQRSPADSSLWGHKRAGHDLVTNYSNNLYDIPAKFIHSFNKNINWLTHAYEWWRIDAFELWCWRRLLRVSWSARKSNQSILRKISPEHSLEGLMLKLKLQYSGHLMQRTDSWKRLWCWARLKAGEGDNKGRDGWMASQTWWTWVWANSRSWWWTGRPAVLQSMGSQRVGHDWGTKLNWYWAGSALCNPMNCNLPGSPVHGIF